MPCDGDDDAVQVTPPDGPGPAVRWSLAGAEPTWLVLRLAATAAGVGVVGGAATACLSVLYELAPAAPAARILIAALPAVLVVLVGWRLAAASGRIASSPSSLLLGSVAAAGVVLMAVVQGRPEAGAFGEDFAHNAAVSLGVLLYGALYGVMPAVAVVVVCAPVLLLLRATRAGITMPFAQVLLTVFAMAVSAVFAQWITTELGTESVAGVAAALAGTGTVLTARWCLVGRQA